MFHKKWVAGSVLAEALGVSKKTIYRYRENEILPEGSYINISPCGIRPTYRYDLEECLKRFGITLEE